MGKLIDILGKTYHRLTVVELDHSTPRNTRGFRHFYKCLCSCGNTCIVEKGNVVDGNTKSCGCIMHEGTNARKHGEITSKKQTKEYRSWSGMKGRCYCKSNKKYPLYGNRGITVCDRWRYSFANFLSDMGRAPSPTDSVGRINNDGNYEPSNCRWETPMQQGGNKRGIRWIEYKGQTKSLTEWGRVLGIDESCLRYRLNSNWSVDRAFTTPSRG